jgi:hypothetical protein
MTKFTYIFMKSVLFFFLLSSLVFAEVEKEVPLGVETVAGYRSSYVHRGFKLANDFIDFQLQSEMAIDNHFSISGGAWYGRGTNSDSKFSEAGGFIDFTYDKGNFLYGFSSGYRNTKNSFFQSGFELSPFITWKITEDIDVTAAASYDTGAQAWYGKMEGEWTKPLTEKSFIGVLLGASVVNDYYERNGLNDFYGRFSYTYQLAKNVSFTPFVGSSIGLGDNDEDTTFGGAWFEVTF